MPSNLTKIQKKFFKRYCIFHPIIILFISVYVICHATVHDMVNKERFKIQEIKYSSDFNAYFKKYGVYPEEDDCFDVPKLSPR